MSEWKQGAAKRRDARNAKDSPEAPKPAAASTKKNTKKWCRGKQGVEHKPVCRDYKDVKQSMRGHVLEDRLYKGWKLLVCAECGKELDYYYPMDFGGKVKPPPDWAK